MPQRDSEPTSPSSTGPGASYVYPVRSLLTGIQAPVASPAPVPNTPGGYLNFRHFPGEDSELQSFVSQPQDASSSGDSVPETVRGPTGELLSYVPTTDRDSDEINPRHPEPISAAGAAALVDGNYAGSDSDSSLVSSGLVHLAPVPSDPQLIGEASSGASSHHGSVHGSQSGSTSDVAQGTSVTGSTGSSCNQDPAPPSIRYSDKSLDTPEPLVTVRFEHISNEHGHHVVVGREGKLARCEDEPIRVPGAVQGFGVLVALHDDEETGNLVVRQVSENASELLGLSPQYLFSLDCFTRVLPDSQADTLWDNIQFLNDPELDDADHPHEGPQVFLLSGCGEPGSAFLESEGSSQEHKLKRRSWTCWCAAHRPPTQPDSRPLIILEFELERDLYNPLYPPYQTGSAFSGGSSLGSGSAGSRGSADTGSSTLGTTSGGDSEDSRMTSTLLLSAGQSNQQQFNVRDSQQGLQGDDAWFPSPEDVLESTTSHSKPLRALERMRRVSRDPTADHNIRGDRGHGRRGARSGGIGTMDIFALLAQINDQLATAGDLDSFLKVVVGVIKDLSQFHRVLVYQFDEMWNGQVVAELVDWNQTHDLYRGLHFPAADIPVQARELYCLNKVRLLYDRSQTTARLVVRSKSDLNPPLDMTHSFLRAMSPIHIKYLGNMGVRASMSISIVTFGALWGLITCHSYGSQGMRVSFPVRQMLRLLSDSISRNIERLSYAHRLHTRKLISTLPTDSHPTGYIVSNAEDLLSLFDADYGVLVIGEGAKILGPNEHGQEILILAEYLRMKQFELIQVSQAVTADFPDLGLPVGLEVISGLLYVPLSSGGKDFIALLRRGQMRDVHWAGKPIKDDSAADAILEPRKSFKMWSETVVGRCRAWTDEQLETAGVLALVYGKFIEVWRQKETALQTTQLTNLLLSNASHEVRTPLNHIINYLELALNGPLDGETRENLTRSHTASKSLLFTINDLLDLTRMESGNETSFNEPFDLQTTIDEAVNLYKSEATRRGLDFQLDISNSPRLVLGDSRKIRTAVANLTANAIKYTSKGTITVQCQKFEEPLGLRSPQQIAVEIVVADTGCGISESKLESMFREFEQVESTESKSGSLPGLGLGLAVVARIVTQLGGQLRIDSKPSEGSRFSFLLPFTLHSPSSFRADSVASSASTPSRRSLCTSEKSAPSEIEIIVDALSTNHMAPVHRSTHTSPLPPDGTFPVEGSKYPVRGVKVDEFDLDKPTPEPVKAAIGPARLKPDPTHQLTLPPSDNTPRKLRVLVVDDDTINRTILSKRLRLDGHTVLGSANGQEGVQAVESDRAFDCVLMDIQMPILDGFEATKQIRAIEKRSPGGLGPVRTSVELNGRIPIFAVSASLAERQREDMLKLGLDGWILKPIDFKRMGIILRGITDPPQRQRDIYHAGCNWEAGGWLAERRVDTKPPSSDPDMSP